MNKFEVTLKQLREHKACVSGYNKVVSALKGIEFDYARDTYIRFKHDKPISLLSIIETNGLDDALWCLRCNNTEWARDSRLFAVWCTRQVQHLLTDERSISALDVTERFANGNATQEEVDAASEAASAAAWAASVAARAASVAARAASEAARAAAWAASEAARAARAAASEAASEAASAAAWAAASDAARATSEAASEAASDAARAAARAAQTEMFIKMCNCEADWQVLK